MSDSLMKALAYNNEIRVYAIDATEMVEEARQLHGSWNTATAAMGRAMIGSTLLAATLKNEQDRLTVRIQGDGPLGYIVVEGNMHGEMRAYVKNPQVSLDLNDKGKIDVKGAVGTEGALSVTKDQGLKNPFVGQVPLVSGELAEDFTYYMAVSEQTPSSFGLSVLVNPDETVQVAGGFMLQVLPGASEETIDQLEEAIRTLPQVSDFLAQERDLEKLLRRLVGEGNYKVLEEMPVSFTCDCSKERFANALSSLGEDEIQQMIDEDGGAEAQCHFCRKKYQYSVEELEEIKAATEK
jgi:molecular chaperone Hsp33